ncbi:accessory gland protein Acp29AB [Drosophila teissieri]|uniref:accessory gland protein Acp29AB n=1 Tax=Drosophila teissieri TaxID=7243 RepID=UPI001CBA44A3|nr:accessory gland protein Acp29AB [Drosophila teissieri]
MYKYATSFFCVLALWNLWEVSANEVKDKAALPEPPTPYYTIDNIGEHQVHWFNYNSLRQNATLWRVYAMEKRLESQLQALQTQLDANMQSLRKQISNDMENLNRPKKSEMSAFKKVGSRYFYLETKSKKSWDAASDTCRRMGGHLANIYNEKELNEIFKGAPDYHYWVDLNSRQKRDFNFISSLTGRTAPFFKWKSNQEKVDEYCASVYDKEMIREQCADKNYFACQAEQWA